MVIAGLNASRLSRGSSLARTDRRSRLAWRSSCLGVRRDPSGGVKILKELIQRPRVRSFADPQEGMGGQWRL
jgi:hypothetical protein